MLILLCGNYKSGKTVSAATFPKPMLFLDYDEGFLSVQTTKTKTGNLIVPDWKDIEVVPFYKKDVYDLFLLTDTGKKTSPPHVKEAGNLVALHNSIFRSLQKDGCYNNKGPFKTLVIDSLTEMFRIWKEGVLLMNNQGSLAPGDYGTLEELLFGQFIPSLKTLIATNKIEHVILIDHIMYEKDEFTGMLQELPVAPSRNMARVFGRAFNDVWLQKQEGPDYVWRIVPAGLFQSGSRSGLPDFIKPATFQTLEQILKQRS